MVPNRLSLRISLFHRLNWLGLGLSFLMMAFDVFPQLFGFHISQVALFTLEWMGSLYVLLKARPRIHNLQLKTFK